MSKYTDAFTQVYVILNELDDNAYDKIPPEVVDAIRKNRNKEYKFEVDKSIDLKDNDLLPEARALLFKIYRDYLATPEQRVKIIKMQNEERRKSELRKQQQYNKEVFENKKLESEPQTNQPKTQLVLYKENVFKKICKKLKGIFKK
ncbi:MAG: hypothetical protein J5881_02300 [Clostridia bacterium]|nr:hypothetical protein [Clostridia bacterium]